MATPNIRDLLNAITRPKRAGEVSVDLQKQAILSDLGPAALGETPAAAAPQAAPQAGFFKRLGQASLESLKGVLPSADTDPRLAFLAAQEASRKGMTGLEAGITGLMQEPGLRAARELEKQKVAAALEQKDFMQRLAQASLEIGAGKAGPVGAKTEVTIPSRAGTPKKVTVESKPGFFEGQQFKTAAEGKKEAIDKRKDAEKEARAQLSDQKKRALDDASDRAKALTAQKEKFFLESSSTEIDEAEDALRVLVPLQEAQAKKAYLQLQYGYPKALIDRPLQLTPGQLKKAKKLGLIKESKTP